MTPAELQTWRNRAGLSQAGLALLLGVATMTVSRWERGVREIPSFLHLALRGIEAQPSIRHAVDQALDEISEGMADPEMKAYVTHAVLARTA